MNVQIVSLPERWIMGPQTRIQPTSADYGALWRDGYDPHDAAIRPLATESGYYGLYYGSEQPGWVDFVAGMMVAASAQPPEGCLVRPVPAGMYARIVCTMSTIGGTWGALYAAWLPSSGYVEDGARPAMEYYAPDAMGPEAPVVLYVALIPRDCSSRPARRDGALGARTWPEE